MIRFHYDQENHLVVTADHRSETILDADEVLSLIAALASRSDHTLAARSMPEAPSPKAIAESRVTPITVPIRRVTQREIERDVALRSQEDSLSERQRAQDTAVAKYPDLEIIGSAAYWADKKDLSQTDLQEILENPDEKWNPAPGNADIFIKNNHAILKARDNHTILAVIDSEIAHRKYQKREHESSGRSMTISGGKKRKYPETVRELIIQSKAHGLHCEIVKSGHYRITNGDKVVVTSVSPSDTNAMKNATRDIEKAFGVSLA